MSRGVETESTREPVGTAGLIDSVLVDAARLVAIPLRHSSRAPCFTAVGEECGLKLRCQDENASICPWLTHSVHSSRLQ